MKNQYHILNGDLIREQLPDQITGEIIVCRECLVDGPVDGETLDELFETRSNFIATNYNRFTKEGYYKKAVSEFTRIQKIPAVSEINLWFEYDLFCQVNLWFVCSLLKDYFGNSIINLVQPEESNQYDFGALKESELLSVYNNRIQLVNINKLADLWGFYQHGKVDEMLKIERELKKDLPFLRPAIQAHLDRTPTIGNPGRPAQTLAEIRGELKTDNFGKIFREFSKRESIYGFGDLQVKRLLDELSMR